jgi:PIN domain nuclease of toxin-antitoxin system
MIAGVADTHAALWYLFGDPRLSAPPKAAFDAAASSRQKIVLSVISLAEVVYLVEKNRLPTSAYADLKTALYDPDHVLQEAPVTAEIIDTMVQVPRVDIPDMPDRIVAATAVYFGVPAISRDGRIHASNIQTVW